MSQDFTAPASPPGPPPGAVREPEQPKSVFLVSYPKVVFLYPTFFAALIAGVYMLIAQDPARTDTYVVSGLFMAVFAVNLVVFAFDFPRTTSLTLFFFLVAVVLGILLLFRFNSQILPFLHEALSAYQPSANATFYFSITGALGAVFLAVLINVQFDYWEITPNELLHHHGVLSNLERFASPSLKIDKEINDVFEYFLLRSGRLILHPSDERRAIVLENVLGINRKEATLTKMLGALQVQVRTGPAG
ncbi:MAG: hypothetical protein ACM3U2_03145 [Deltaproteobacteria bacterium]